MYIKICTKWSSYESIEREIVNSEQFKEWVTGQGRTLVLELEGSSLDVAVYQDVGNRRKNNCRHSRWLKQDLRNNVIKGHAEHIGSMSGEQVTYLNKEWNLPR